MAGPASCHPDPGVNRGIQLNPLQSLAVLVQTLQGCRQGLCSGWQHPAFSYPPGRKGWLSSQGVWGCDDLTAVHDLASFICVWTGHWCSVVVVAGSVAFREMAEGTYKPSLLQPLGMCGRETPNPNSNTDPGQAVLFLPASLGRSLPCQVASRLCTQAHAPAPDGSRSHPQALCIASPEGQKCPASRG